MNMACAVKAHHQKASFAPKEGIIPRAQPAPGYTPVTMTGLVIPTDREDRIPRCQHSSPVGTPR